MSRLISLAVLIACIVVISVLCYRVMAGFLIPLFLAALLVVIFRPLHLWTLDKCRGPQRTAAALTTAAILLIVLLPLGWLASFAVAEGIRLATRFEGSPVKLQDRLDAARRRLGVELPYASRLRELETALDQLASLAAPQAPSDPDDATATASHQALGQLQLAVNQLGAELAAEGDAIPPRAVAKRLRDRQDFEQLRGAVDALQALPPDDEGYATQIRQVQLAYSHFRTQLLGGTFRAMLTEFSNPNESQTSALIRQAKSWLQEWLLSVSRPTAAYAARFLLGLAIMTVALYYFLADGPRMISTVMQLSPLDDQYERELLGEFDMVSRAVVIASLLSAVVQGVLAGIGFFFAGLDSVFLLTFLTMVMALIPFVGAAAVWVPVCLWLGLVEGRMLAAVLLAVYGAGIVSMADNVIKPLVLHGQSRLHPLLALLSVLGGVQALGPIGIVLGPMVVSFLQALLTILQKELTALDRHTRPARGSP